MKLERLALIQSCFSLLSKFSGYLRDASLAFFIGTTAFADIFFMAMRIPVSFEKFLSAETFNAAFIPIFGKISKGGNIEKKYHFAHQLIIGTLFILIPIVVTAEIFMPNIVSLFAENIQDQYSFSLFVKAARIMFPYILFIGVSSIFIGILNTYGRFALSAGLPFIINLSIISSCFLFTVIPAERVTILSWSVIVGGIFQLAVLIFTLRKHFFKDLYVNLFNLNKDYLALKNFLVLYWPTLLASFLVFFNQIFGILIASKDIGGVSLLYYSERVYYLPLTIIGVSIGSVLLPILSSKGISNGIEVKEIQDKAFRYSVLTIFPITLILFFFSETIISLFFYRGAFDIEALTRSAFALKLYLIGLPSAVIVKMLIPYLYSTRQPKIVLKTIVISTLCCIVMTLMLFPIIGYLAVPIAISLASWINMFLLIWVHYKLDSFKLNFLLVKYTLKSIFFAFTIFYFLYFIDAKLSYYVLNIIYKLVIELLLIVPPTLYFLYKMESELLKKFISFVKFFLINFIKSLQ